MRMAIKVSKEVRALLLKSVAKAGTVTHLGECVGVNPKSVSKWLKGEAAPTTASICKLEYFVEFGPSQDPLFHDDLGDVKGGAK